jgi:hypothetical protein
MVLLISMGNNRHEMTKRRDFLKKSLLGTAGIAIAGVPAGAEPIAGEKTAGPNSITGGILDAAPFAKFTSDEGGKAYSLRWAEPRKIRSVVIELPQDIDIAKPESFRLQYWHQNWDGKADPILAESGTGGAGWTKIDDWTNGVWKDADTNLHINGNKLTFDFNSTDEKEFKKLKQNSVRYRKTLKLRFFSDQSVPVPVRFQAFTDAVCRELTVRILLGKPAESSIKTDGGDSGTLEIFNGSIKEIRPIKGSTITIKENLGWILPAGSAGGIEADLIIAVDPVDQRYDRTILTLRSKHRSASFLPDSIAEGERILIDDLGILAVRGDDIITLEGYRNLRKEFPGKTIYDRIVEHDEQTLSKAWNDMPIKHPIGFVHGLPGNRNVIKHLPDGDIEISNSKRWFSLNKSSKDSSRKGWRSDMPKLLFGLPGDEYHGGRELSEGYLPCLRSWWQKGPLYYEQVTIMGKLENVSSEVHLDDPTLLLMQIRIVNISSSEEAKAGLEFASYDNGREKLAIEGDRVMADSGGQKKFRYLIKSDSKGTFSQMGETIKWSAETGPGETHKLVFLIPSITIDKNEDIAALLNIDFDSSCMQMRRFWADHTAKGSLIQTPEPWLNDFYKAHYRHMMVNCLHDLDSDRLYAHVGTFSYGVFSNESIMMVSDLDRRGYHKEAENCFQTWLDFQGSVPLPGNFIDKEGLFYGAAGSEDGGYNKHHGYVMWGMGEHWWFTRDRAWMEKAAPKLILACDWVIRQRKLTMVSNPDGTRPIEYGFLPTGGLEDVQDFWHWLATNSATVWGFNNLSAALEDYGHFEAGRLVREAKAYQDDVNTGLKEARILAPVVRLRDGTYVPKYPSRLYERGRCNGWIRETLEGPVFLIVQGLISAGSTEAKWIMKDYEDNLYISDNYGYSIPVFDRFWFSRGGFSMQSQLLDSPIPYIKDDKIKHFLRAYFNGFTAAFFPQVRMCNEHALPELGYPAGDYFKTSDEAQSTYWLRLMFIREDGEDLYLGQAIPRYWLTSGKNIGIERAATHFGVLTFKLKSFTDSGKITAIFYPPERNDPRTIYLRIRHPESKPIKGVTLNGKPYDKFDAEKEWVILPGSVRGIQEVVAEY